MEKQSVKETTKGVLAVTFGTLVVLAPYSLLIGWNLITALLFWFVIVPCIAIYLPAKVSGSKNHLIESLLGLVVFYAFIVFMIYDHYKSDQFLVMMVSCGVNLIIVSAIYLTRRVKVQAV